MTQPFSEQSRTILNRLTLPGASISFVERDGKDEDGSIYYYARFKIQFYNQTIFEANRNVSLSWIIGNIINCLNVSSVLKVDLRESHIQSPTQ